MTDQPVEFRKIEYVPKTPTPAGVPKAGVGTSHQTLDETPLLDETPMAGYRDVEEESDVDE